MDRSQNADVTRRLPSAAAAIDSSMPRRRAYGVRSVEIGESASYSQRAQHEGKQIAALVTEKFQRGEDRGLTDDQHHYPFEQVHLVGFYRRQQLALESVQIVLEFDPKEIDLVAEAANIALCGHFFAQRLIEAIGHGTGLRLGEARRFQPIDVGEFVECHRRHWPTPRLNPNVL